MNAKTFLYFALGAACSGTAFAHDTWLQANTSRLRAGDAVYLDLMLGNHGNDRRDFKMAGKADLAASAITVLAPDGTAADLKPAFQDRGFTPKDGYWSARFRPVQAGPYLVSQTSDQVAGYAPERLVRSAKVLFFVGSPAPRPSRSDRFDRPLGPMLELVPAIDSLDQAAPGRTIRVRLFYRGQPLAGENISLVPRSRTLTAGFDPRYERQTDADGAASFSPAEPDIYLIVAHHLNPADRGPGYTSTLYGATLTVIVPGP